MVAEFDAHPQKVDIYKFLAGSGSNINSNSNGNASLHNPSNLYNREAYRKEWEKLDVTQLRKDIKSMLKDSKPWWPADYNHYGPFMVRFGWHQAGTYRSYDGRGGACNGNMRFRPFDSWRDNGNLDKARRLCWPIKQKYGSRISWSDLIILVSNVAQEDMGLTSKHGQPLPFMFGRIDNWCSEPNLYIGMTPERDGPTYGDSYAGLKDCPEKLEKPLGATETRLIYVNPEGPDGCGDPKLAWKHIKVTFGRMGLNDREIVALIGGGHTFGKCHGAGDPKNVQDCPEDNDAVENLALGWKNKLDTGVGKDAITSGLEGAWTAKPSEWDHGFFTNLFKFQWEQFNSPAGAKQYRPKNHADSATNTVPLAHDKSKSTYPIMLTTDLALLEGDFAQYSKEFHEHPDAFKQAFIDVWFKLCHRDMGPLRRGWGSDVPVEKLWQDPIKPLPGAPVSPDSIDNIIKPMINDLKLHDDVLIRTAWNSASTWRKSDNRGGSNGGRIRLLPMNSWEENNPTELKDLLGKLEKIKDEFNGKKETIRGEVLSMADLIILAGNVGVENCIVRAKSSVKVPFSSGRGDATQEESDVVSLENLRSNNDQDPFRCYSKDMLHGGPASLYNLLDKSSLLNLNVSEMVVLYVGLRAMHAINPQSHKPGVGGTGIFTDFSQKLDSQWFRNLMDSENWLDSDGWKKQTIPKGSNIGNKKNEITYFTGTTREGKKQVTASKLDLIFGHHVDLRAVCEWYAYSDNEDLFVQDFVNAWVKVMEADKYDGKWS